MGVGNSSAVGLAVGDDVAVFVGTGVLVGSKIWVVPALFVLVIGFAVWLSAAFTSGVATSLTGVTVSVNATVCAANKADDVGVGSTTVVCVGVAAGVAVLVAAGVLLAVSVGSAVAVAVKVGVGCSVAVGGSVGTWVIVGGGGNVAARGMAWVWVMATAAGALAPPSLALGVAREGFASLALASGTPVASMDEAGS